MGVQDMKVIQKSIKTESGASFTTEEYVGKTIHGLKVMVPFDQFYEEIQYIIANAFNNYDRNDFKRELFDYYMEKIDAHTMNKPYLKNLIKN